MNKDTTPLPGEADKYLTGEKFSSGQQIRPVIDKSAPLSRSDCLVSMVSGRSVVHIGCADHLELIDEKISVGTWLHARLAAVSSRCVGFDINGAAIEHIRNRHGRSDVHCADVVAEVPSALGPETWDVAVLGEMIEHVDDPVIFLRALRSNLAGRVREVIITAPNAWDQLSVRKALRGIEYINTDHRYWFTPYTLAMIGRRAGFRCRHIAMCSSVPSGTFRHAPMRWFLSAAPLFRECIVMSFVLNVEA